MGTYTGTTGGDTITPGTVSNGVTRDPPGSRPDGNNDTLSGLGGNDVLNGGGGNDSLFGGDGRDDLTGGTGGDFLDGGIGDDVLNGGSENDTLSGGDGNDSLTGGTGNDSLQGGLGNDTYVFQEGFGFDTVFESTNSGNDRVEFGSGIAPGEISFRVDGDDLILTLGDDGIRLQDQYFSGQGGNARLEKLVFANGTEIDIRNVDPDWLDQSGTGDGDSLSGSIFADNIRGLGGNDSIFGQAGNDTLTGGSGGDFLDGGVGNDDLDGGSEADNLSGSDGNDTLDGGDANDFLSGGVGRDTLVGGANEDTLSGGADADVLNGGLGNDVLNGDDGNDTLTGAEGVDTFTFLPGGGSDRITDFDNGKDFLRFSGFGVDFDTAAEIIDRAEQDGQDVLISLRNPFGGQTRVTIEDFTLAQLNAADFVF
jgi:Ca2+-binding RTX toxin-like protein